MFTIVEGRNHWVAEGEFVAALRKEVEDKQCTLAVVEGSRAFLSHIRSKPEQVDFLFVSGILSLVDSRSGMSKENREVCSWFAEHRKVESEHIVLSDVFELSYIDLRVKKLVTHRVRVTGPIDDVHYRIVSFSIGRSVNGRLNEGMILEALVESNRPLTPEEVEKAEKEFEQAMEGEK